MGQLIEYVPEPVDAASSADSGRRQVVTVPVAMLALGESPRSGGRDADHVARLAEVDSDLPPILVERGSMRVVDGMHRLMAAVLRGRESIEVEFFDGNAEDAFLRAVEMNVLHGLPLSHADRRAAAGRIMASHPYMSDRAIARAAGLGARTVATLRRRSTEAAPQLNARVGRDGKVRPLSGVEGRQRAAELIAERPLASLREVARLAGISPTTVSDVRRRLARGESPVAAPAAEATDVAGAQGEPGASDALSGTPRCAGRARVERRAHRVHSNPDTVLEKLLRDPSLRHKEEGRQLLRLLRQNAIAAREWSELISAVPPHCGAQVVDLARQYAETWEDFAQELDERVVRGLPDDRQASAS